MHRHESVEGSVHLVDVINDSCMENRNIQMMAIYITNRIHNQS